MRRVFPPVAHRRRGAAAPSVVRSLRLPRWITCHEMRRRRRRRTAHLPPCGPFCVYLVTVTTASRLVIMQLKDGNLLPKDPLTTSPSISEIKMFNPDQNRLAPTLWRCDPWPRRLWIYHQLYGAVNQCPSWRSSRSRRCTSACWPPLPPAGMMISLFPLSALCRRVEMGRARAAV